MYRAIVIIALNDFQVYLKKKKPAESCIYEKIITKMGYSMLKKKSFIHKFINYSQCFEKALL